MPDNKQVQTLKLTLYDRLNVRNVLTFAEEFIADIDRPTFSLTTHPNFPIIKQRHHDKIRTIDENS